MMNVADSMGYYRIFKRVFPLFLVAVIMVLPQMSNVDSYVLSTLIFVGIYSIVTVSLCLLMGYAGQISLGHAAFFGMGAYGSAILTAKFGYNPWFAMLMSSVLTCTVAFLIGVPTLKLKEHYLALATLGFGIVVYMIFKQETFWTGGPSGFMGIPYLYLGDFRLAGDYYYYYFVWIVTFVTVFVCRNIVNSRVGRALKAIHGSEVAAEAMGVDTAKYKLQIFVVSAFFASIAGSLLAHYITVINPSSFGFSMSIDFVLMAVVGGIASIWGPLVGVALVTFLTQFLRELIPTLIPGAGGEVETVLYGLILAVIMIYMPEGLFRGIVDRLENLLYISGKIKRRKREAEEEI